MAHAFTTGEKAVQRLDGQWSQFFLGGAIGLTPYSSVYTAQLGTPPTTTDDIDTIAFVSGSGTLANVTPDMLLKVGTTAGAADLGVARIRKAPISGTFYIGEISDINWLAGGTIYLTVVDDFGLWEKQLKIVSGVFYMDVDIAYTDQNTLFDPVIVLGSHRIGIIPTGSSSIQITLGPEQGTLSWVLGPYSITGVTWSCPGSTAIDNVNNVNPKVTYNAAGKYLAYCTGVAGNGKSFTAVRYVFIYDDTHPAIGNIQIKNFEISDYNNGGWSCSVLLPAGSCDIATIQERALVGLISNDFAQTAAQAMPVIKMDGAENIRMWGWIEDETIVVHPESGDVEFTIQGAQYWMQKITGFTEGLEIVASSSKWTDMPQLSVDKGLFVLFHWRSTLTRIMDFLPSLDGRLVEVLQNGGSENLWQQAQDFASSTIGANLGVDRYGRLFVSVEPQLIRVSDRIWPTVTDIFMQDMGELNFTRKEVPDIGMLTMSGVAVDANGTPSAFFSNSPGLTYKRYGQDLPSDNWLVVDQTQSNELAGLYTGWKNNKYQNFQIKMPYVIWGLDCFPRQTVHLVIPSSRDPRGVGYDDLAIIRSMRISTDPKRTGGLTMELTLEGQSYPELAITGLTPATTNPNLPPLPKFPKLPLPPPTIPVPVGFTKNVQLRVPGKGIFYTQNFGDPLGTNWLGMNTGFPFGWIAANYLFRLEVTLSGRLFLHCADGFNTDPTLGIWMADRVGANWSPILTLAKVRSDYGITSPYPSPKGDVQIYCMGINRGVDNEQVAIAGHVFAVSHFPVTNIYVGSTIGAAIASPEAIAAGGIFGDMKYGSGNYCAMFNGNGNDTWSNKVSRAGGLTSQTDLGNFLLRIPKICRAGVDGLIVYMFGDPIATMQRSVDGGGSFTNLPSAPAVVDCAACDPSGNSILAGPHTGNTLRRSPDAGATWASISEVFHVTALWNLGTPNDWIIGTDAGEVYYTTDFGTTLLNYTGDLATWIGSNDVTEIRNY